MDKLFIVSTPIGNLEDTTVRAIKTLFSVDIILCEDTRRTGQLLHQLKKKYKRGPWQILPRVPLPVLIAFHQHNERRETARIVQLLKMGKSVALVSDAGTPLLCDPGYLLVKECLKRKIPLVPIPGPSSILASLVASGLPAYPFLFLGYPPEKSAKRIRWFKNLAHLGGGLARTPRVTVIFFASPHKIIQIFEDLSAVFGDIQIVVARELTKIHEEFVRDEVGTVIEQFKKTKPKGELTVLFQL